ncbi:MAG: Uma2 family endonuclease [Tunicatimonas sp.]
MRKPKTLEAFLRWEQPEGYYKYEWVDGALEKTEYMMKTNELAIVRNIKKAFYQTDFFRQQGELFAEVAVKLSEERVRIPDISAFTDKQINAAQGEEYPVPAFAIEIISPNESGFKIEQKAFDYFAAGVQVLWQIYPNLRMVKVLTSPQAVQVCLTQDVCSAAPAVPDLTIAADQVFGENVEVGKDAG